MTAPTITDLPAAPQRTQAATEFSTTADTFVAALPGLVADVNAASAYIEQAAADAGASAAEAAAAAAAVDLAASQAATGLPLVTGHALDVLTVAADEGSVGWAPAARLPAGIILFVDADDAPAGTLKANGADVSREAYAALFAVIGTRHGGGDGESTFNLPDYRGRFLRALDDGAGIDTGRALGSEQADELAGHTHSSGTLAAGSAGTHAHTYDRFTGGPTGGWTTGPSGGNVGTQTTYAGSHTHAVWGSTASTGGAETRPINIAALAVITY
jgi:microcystin-dependent protein